MVQVLPSGGSTAVLSSASSSTTTSSSSSSASSSSNNSTTSSTSTTREQDHHDDDDNIGNNAFLAFINTNTMSANPLKRNRSSADPKQSSSSSPPFSGLEKTNDGGDNDEEEDEDHDEHDDVDDLVGMDHHDSDSSNDDNSDNNENNNNINKNSNTQLVYGGMSRLFAPYRTVGIVSSCYPFHLIPHQNSSTAMMCIPIGDRFQLVQTDKLRPIMVSRSVPPSSRATTNTTTTTRTFLSSATTSSSLSSTIQTKSQIISHVISDAALSITLVAHGNDMSDSSSNTSTGGTKNRTNPHYYHQSNTVTLYQRTIPTRTLCLSRHPNNKNDPLSNKWIIRDFISTGKIRVAMRGEKEGGPKENALVVVAIMSYENKTTTSSSLVSSMIQNQNYLKKDGESDNDTTTNDSESVTNHKTSSGNHEQEDDDDIQCRGQLVILIATRTTLHIHRRIQLSTIPTFIPRTAIHPSTYLNKIVVGGYDSMNHQPFLCLMNIRSGKVIHIFQCIQVIPPPHHHPYDSEDEMITTMTQSPAVDTIAVGTNHGYVHLINLQFDQRLFTLAHRSSRGSGVGFGVDVDGSHQRNISSVTITSISFRTDGSAMKYNIAPMAVGRSDGTITIWDLTTPQEKGAGRTILCELNQVHPGGVGKVQYLPQEPLLLSTGWVSNSILMHIFDSPDNSGRILRQRKGHTAPPCRIRYLHPGTGAGGGILANASDGTDASSCQILSSGGFDRTLRVFSTARTVLDKEYSQGPGLEKKARKLGLDGTVDLLLPPLLDLANAEVRSRDWGDLVTIHKDHSLAYVWSTCQGSQSGPVLRQPSWNVSAMKEPPPPQSHATSVAISACGNFALVGTRGGIIYRYNIQSGNSRGSYPKDATQDTTGTRKVPIPGDVRATIKAFERTSKVSNRSSNLDKKDLVHATRARKANLLKAKLRHAHHTQAVTGIAVDSMNKMILSVGSDAKLILWYFSTHSPHKKSPFTLPCPATRLCHIRESDLAAIALDDFSVVLFDCSAQSIVRRFGNGTTRHLGAITDIGFSPDGRTLYTASIDSTIRVWDVPTNSCVDWLGFEAPPTSLTISPTGEFLATTHMGRIGISIWSDRSYYQNVNTYSIDLMDPIPMDSPVPISDFTEPSISQFTPQSTDDDLLSIIAEEVKEDAPVLPKDRGLVTLSGLPPAHWKNLFHLELVKERNKPKEPPKKPPSAPFFLQWRSGEQLSEKAETNVEKTGATKADQDEWLAAWSDDDEGKIDMMEMNLTESTEPAKRRKLGHHRSHLATLLLQCSEARLPLNCARFGAVTDYIATLGPSAIDLALSSLCSGKHDVEEGLPLLILAAQWLVEACESRERFEAVNAYLHRYLHIHASIIAGVDLHDDGTDKTESETKVLAYLKDQQHELIDLVLILRKAQGESSETLRKKMQHTICLLRHFSRMA